MRGNAPCSTARDRTFGVLSPRPPRPFSLTKVGPAPRPTKTRRSVDAYPDFQSVTRTHRLQAGGCLVLLSIDNPKGNDEVVHWIINTACKVRSGGTRPHNLQATPRRIRLHH